MAGLFDSTGFMPHGHCYLWRPELVVLHVTSDVLIAASYFVIPALMLSFLRRRRDVPLRPVFVAFALFIISCGTTHLMEIVTLWDPRYWASGLVKAFTAVVSIGTVALLIPAVPRAVALPSPEQLRAANDRLAAAVNDLQLTRLVLQEMKLGVLLVRAHDGVIVFANPRAEQLLDHGSGALAGVPMSTLLEDGASMASLKEPSALQASERQLEVTWRTPSGRSVWTQATLGRVSDPVQGTVFAIRLRDRAEVERSLLADIVQTTNEAVIAVGVDGLVRTWNIGAERLYGYEAAEAVGRPFAAITGAAAQYPSSDAPLVHDASHRTRAGGVRDVVVTVTPVRAPDGQLVAISKLVHDVTERRAAERALATSLKEKEVLIQELHHRVKNNLQLVSSLLSIQADAVPNPDTRTVFVEVQGRVRAMALLHEVLYQSTALARVPFEDFARRLSSSVARIHTRPGLSLSTQVTAPELTMNMEGGVPLALVLNELCVNAFKHAFRSDRVEHRLNISGRVDGDDVLLTVEDDGVGLRPGFTLTDGAGVGLRLVISLLGQLKGRLDYEPLAPGTRWVMRLPRQRVLA